MGAELAIGVDIGGTKIAFALVNRDGETLATERLPTLPEEGAEAVFGRVAQGVKMLLGKSGGEVAGVGIGCPGHLNPHTGVVHNATNLAWREVALVEGVRVRLDNAIPLWLAKDANAAALGEMYFGAARGCRDFALLALGTGLGGGAVVNGELVVGGNFAAMEIGHMPFQVGGRLCACGMRGCPEMYASGNGLLAGAREHLPAYPGSRLAQGELTTAAIIEAAEAGDALALAVIDEAATWLVSVMVCLRGIFDPTLFVVGGGMGHAAWKWLQGGIERAWSERVVEAVYRTIPVIESQVRSSAVGAACLVWHGRRA